VEWAKDEFVLTDNSSRLDLDRTFLLLHGTYWGVRRPREVVAKMVEHSLCFILLRGDLQVGFGRAVTDYTVFSWIADLVVESQYRSQGVGKWMMDCIGLHPAIQHTQMVLQTRDAHDLYAKYGFTKNPALMSTAVIGL
jgi:GNAT superfamily N-acetyltransferase